MNDEPPITHHPERHRFELQEGGHTAYEEYFFIPQGVVFAHTIVPPELGGRGIAGRIVQHALAWARQGGLQVRPDCSFVRAYMDKHPEYADMRLPI
ncbi:MAG: GNAT family N-acetyltransferase [Brachymonas sp.]|jgi:predicted GNAT family acetyltransferase